MRAFLMLPLALNNDQFGDHLYRNVVLEANCFQNFSRVIIRP